MYSHLINRLLIALLALGFPVVEILSADETEERWVWDLSPLFESPEAWQEEFDAVSADIPILSNFQGRLSESATTLLEAIEERNAFFKRTRALWSYASLRSDEDIRISENRQRLGQMRMMWSRASQEGSFFVPEILGIGEERIQNFMDENPALAEYRRPLENILRNAPHTRTAEVEAVLSQMGTFAGSGSSIYRILANSDLPFPTIELSTGEEVFLNQSNYTRWRSSQNREDRRLVFNSFWKVWQDFRATFGETLNSEVQRNVFSARVRNFDTVLEREFHYDGLPTEIYEQLIKQTNAHLPLLHRYLALRQRMLGLEELRYYDIYPSLIETDRTFPIEKSIEITLRAAKPLGPEYMKYFSDALEGRQMHVFPAPGKRSGAYMSGGPYRLTPYVFLNHNDSFDSLTTFAHEWGHALHSILSDKHQPYHLARYTTFIAEIAAMAKEFFLLEMMIEEAETDEELIFLYAQGLERIRGGFFRQVQFSEFEQAIYQKVESGTSLNGDMLNQTYLEILRRYKGHDEGVMIVDEAYAVEWAFIPHFYRSFYVFQYATSLSAAAAFSERVLSGGEFEREQFMDVLRAGGKMDPHDILLRAEMDMTQPEPYLALMAKMEFYISEIERLLNQKG